MSKNQYAILGFPLKHTMSPSVHARLFQLAKRRAEYLTVECSPERLAGKIGFLKSLGGFNVTIPHKIDIIPYLDELSASAKLYGSVNVVKCGIKNSGFNTDIDGFRRTLNAYHIPLDGSVCVLGCGGVGRMFAIESALAGADLTLAVRKVGYQSARALREEIALLVPDKEINIRFLEDFSGDYDLVINATPVGMHPKIKYSPLPIGALEHVKILFDCVYNPSITTLMKQAAEQGLVVVGGMDMLVWQAVVAHEIWYDGVFDTQDVQKLITDMKQEVDRVFTVEMDG